MPSFLVVLTLKRPDSPFSLILPERIMFFSFITTYGGKLVGGRFGIQPTHQVILQGKGKEGIAERVVVPKDRRGSRLDIQPVDILFRGDAKVAKVLLVFLQAVEPGYLFPFEI